VTATAPADGTRVTVRMPDGSHVLGHVAPGGGQVPCTPQAWRVDAAPRPEGCGLGHDTKRTTCAQAAEAVAARWHEEVSSRVEALVLRPGDRVLLCLRYEATEEMARHGLALLHGKFPDVEFVVVDQVVGLARAVREEET